MNIPFHRLVVALAPLILFFSGADAFADDPSVPEGVIFEKGIEYSNPDDQHPSSTWRPKLATAISRGGAFWRLRSRRDGYNGLCLKLAEQGCCGDVS